jgi:hypothetical protein
MNGSDISLQLIFLGVAILTFIAPSYIPAVFQKVYVKLNPTNESHFGKALLAFSVGGMAQLLVVWLGNIISDSANVWVGTHIVSGVIFGAGTWVAMQFLPKNKREDNAR